MTTSAPHPPIFVICCSRSGSTLLRFVLDSHPQLCAPPELQLLLCCKRILWVQRYTQGPVTDEQAAWNRATGAARAQVDGMMARYCEIREKSTWCEKSISSLQNLDILNGVFPDARVICLYRHAMDVVRSGLEVVQAEHGYDYEVYLQRTPDRPVDAILDYWADMTERQLALERQRPGCARLRYEDLVLQPEATVAALLKSLELDPDPGLLERMFALPHEPGPGDHKIHQTARIEPDSVGRGFEIRYDTISPDRLHRVNPLLSTLEYPCIEPSWGRGPSPFAVPAS